MIDRIYKVYCFWRIHGTSAIRQIFFRKLASKLYLSKNQLQDSIYLNVKPVNASKVVSNLFQSLSPLRTIFIPVLLKPRVNIVTDSISSGSLFGGVGTSLIFAALLCNKLNAHLRIITRTERAKPENVEHILSLYGISLTNELEFKYAPFYDQNYDLDIGPNDLFITTSWWTTAATLPSVSNEKIIYLLQEDERMFYPFGDDRIRCEEILRNQDILFVINTELLFNHFIQDGFENISLRGYWFEPAFPKEVFRPSNNYKSEKRKFFFYARPNNPRNLFYFGIEVIEQAVLQHVINLELWDIYLVGKDIPDVTFGEGYSPKKCENLTWSEYASLLSTVDLGLSLMYTPHPSYPPLDLAASGAVVVTNRFMGKRDLKNYSLNLICADLDKNSLVDAIRVAAVLATNPKLRQENYRNNQLLNDWQIAFDKIINQINETI